MPIKIDSPIVGYSVHSPEGGGTTTTVPGDPTSDQSSDNVAAAAQASTAVDTEAETPAELKTAEVIQMHERVKRPNALVGSTYKIKTPLSEHALYVTINDIVLNPGTEHELRRPFEIFINSKNMEHFQWIVALTVIISAVFRKGGDVTFLVDELRQVFDPRGGYFKKGGRYMPSLVAEIGEAIDSHLRSIGLIRTDVLSDEQKVLIAEANRKRGAVPSTLQSTELSNAPAQQAPATAPAQTSTSMTAGSTAGDATADDEDFPADASFCAKCNDRAVVVMDGCSTCLSCGDSKCG